MTDVLKRTKLSAFTRAEFIQFVDDISNDRAETEAQSDAWVRHFKFIVPHPAKSDLLFWPEDGADDGPEGVVAEIEHYCRKNGLPGFKDSDF